MPRLPKCRLICHFPQSSEFFPSQKQTEHDTVILTVDEYETIRLIDKEGLSQSQCGEQMQIARTTVQKIYNNARKKLADVLVNALPLRIEGGVYELCNGGNPLCRMEECYKQELFLKFGRYKDENVMRIAVTYTNGEIFQHFGHTEFLKIYDVENGKITASEVVDTNGNGHGTLVELLHAMKVNTLICGGIGSGARAALSSIGIMLYGGVSGNADEAVKTLLSGKLDYNPDVHRDHHDHEHEEGHSCGSNLHGSHACVQ